MGTNVDGTSFLVPRAGAADVYCVLVVALPLLLLHGVLWLPFTLLALPGLALCWRYASTLPRPLSRIEGGWRSRFGRWTFATLVVSVPALALLAVWVLVVWTWSVVGSLPFGLLVRGLAQGRWRALWGNIALIGRYTERPAWSWPDLCRSVIGSMHRQGFFEFVFGKPFWGFGSLLLQPVFKYALQCNPLLDELELKFANEWIDPPRPDVSAEDLREFTRTLVCTALHSEAQRRFIDEESTFAPHYPYPAAPAERVTGMQFGEDRKGVFITEVLHDPDLEGLRREGRPIRLEGAQRCLFYVRLGYANPFHPLVGDVFVNVTREHRIEHQMHCASSKSTFFGNYVYEAAHNMFATTFLRAAMRYFERFGLEP